MKKYEFTGEVKIHLGRTLHQIRAVVAFGSVEAGEVGGWIEKMENLSHDGNAWVSGDAWVYGNAWVSGDAWVYGNAWVYGDAWVYGNAWVSGDAWVYGNAWVSGDAQVSGNALVYGNAQVYGNALVYGNAQVYGNAWVSGDAWVYGNAWVSGDAWVYGDAHYLTIGPIGSRSATTTFFRTKDLKIFVACGCFLGDLEAFAKKVKETHGENEHAKIYFAAIEIAKLRIDLNEE